MATNKSNNGTKRDGSDIVKTQQTTKRHKKCVAADLVCPISLELPWDPVTAEDGRVYDRESIEKHFRTHAGSDLKSPITNEPMGTKLLPATQVRNTIASMVEAGDVNGDLAKKWKKKKALQKKEVEDLLKRAEGGDGSDMYVVGLSHMFGRMGFREDHKLAFHWLQRSHKKGCLGATTCLAQCYLSGIGTDRSVIHGVMLLAEAATQGKSSAACDLGMAFADGRYGVPIDAEEAIRWLEKALGSENGLSSDERNKAQSKLAELKQNRSN